MIKIFGKYSSMINSVNMLMFYIVMNNLFEIKLASVIAGNLASPENNRKYIITQLNFTCILILYKLQ